ncbi:unnamed protein product, partial [Cladocopium goreaui]
MANVPSYVAAVDDESECQLLCEADELCEDSTLITQFECEVYGLPSALGTATPEDSQQDTYQVRRLRDPIAPIAPEAGAQRSQSTLSGPRSPRSENSIGSSLRKVLLATYASGKIFEETQQRLHESLAVAEIAEHWAWNQSMFQGSGRHADWYKQHERVNFRRGGAWKPYIIWQALRRVKWGDWLVYHDASRYVQEGFSSSVQPLLSWLEAHRLDNPCECLPAVRLRQTFEHEWLQQCVPPYGNAPIPSHQAADVFCSLMSKLGTCRPNEPSCCTWNWHQSTLQHAWSVWRKNRRSARFLREWAREAEDYEKLAHLPFVDQSLNALLFYRWKSQLSLRALWVPSLYLNSWRQDMDLGSLGRCDGNIFKHLNFILDELWNEGVYRRPLLFLVDPEEMSPEA